MATATETGPIGPYTRLPMDLADHFRTIAANWWRILVIAAVVGAGVFAWSHHQPETYVGQYLITVTPEVDKGQGIDPNTVAIRVANQTVLLNSPTIAISAVKTGKLDAKYGLTPDELRSRLSIASVPLAGTIVIKTSAHGQQEALDEAKAYADTIHDISVNDQDSGRQQQVTDLQNAITMLETALKDPKVVPGSSAATQISQQIDALRGQLALVAAPASMPTGIVSLKGINTLDNNGAPVAPTPGRDGMLAFLVAFVLAAEGFVIGNALSDRVSKAADVETITSLTGLPVLALVPRARGPEVVEAFRTLRTNLMFLEGSRRPRTIAIVSPNPAAGKSFTAVHLAESAVVVDARVVVIDADLRRPVLHQRLNTPREPGLTDAMRGAPLATTLHPVDGYPNLHVMPCGAPVTDTVAALGGREFRGVLDALDGAELIIVDTPPGAGYADALAVSAQCDAALLVLDSETTRKRTTKQFITALERTGATLIGVVVNGAAVDKRDTYERA